MPKRNYLYQTVVMASLLTAGWLVVANAGRRLPETDLAAPGAPLYQYALDESVKSLMSKQEQAELGAKSRPPSPGPDYYWCENCKTYHKRKDPAQQPATVQRPAGTPAVQPVSPAARPPSPGPDYYWCENCKTYHKREARESPHQPAAAHEPGAAQVAHPQPNAGTATIPPSPGPDYYWCRKCQKYHKKQPAGSETPVIHHTPAAAGAAQAPGPDYYYCENCKTYHRRQSIPQHAAVTNRLGGVTNSLYRPLPITPAETSR